MPDVNFGLLQSLPSQGPHTEMVQVPNYALQNEQGLLSGINSMNESFNSASQRANTQSEIAARNQQMQQSEKLFPGVLQAQGLANQGQGLSNQKSQMEIEGAQVAMQQRQERVQAYQAASKRGGSQAGLDAVRDTYFQQGDVESGMKLSESMENLNKKIADDDQSYLVSMGTVAHGIETSATQKGMPALQVYNELYNKGMIQRFDPKAPKPNSFRDNAQFEDTYIHPILDKALPFTQKVADEQKAISEDKVHQANVVIKQSRADLDDAIRQYGAKSQQAQDAATALTRAQQAAQSAAEGNNYITGTIRGIKNILPESLGGTPSPQTVINNAQSGAQTPSTMETIGNTVKGAINNLMPSSQPQQSVPQQAPQQPVQQSGPTQIPQAVLASPADFQTWFSKLSPETQNDIKANPQKYGLNP